MNPTRFLLVLVLLAVPAAPAVLGRLRDGRVVLDVRTVFPEQEAALVEAVCLAAGAR
jgi:hypothetical protein